jgi:hypothetical protein
MAPAQIAEAQSAGERMSLGDADWQAKAEEWLRKTTAPLIDGLIR